MEGLNVITIELPPLNNRKEDIKPLTEHFVKKLSLKHNKKIRGISKAAFNQLLRYDWPGNVRELENVIERAVVLCISDLIEIKDIPLGIEVGKLHYDVESLPDVEREHIKMMLNKTNWNLSEAAKRLSIHRNTLRLKMKEYGIERE